MSPIQRGNVKTKLFQLCSTLKAELLHDGGLHRFRMPRPDQDHLKLFWIFCIYIADMNDTVKNIQTYSKDTINVKVYQAWSRNLVSSCKVCRLEAVAPGNTLKQQQGCTSTLACKRFASMCVQLQKPKRCVIKAYYAHQYASIPPTVDPSVDHKTWWYSHVLQLNTKRVQRHFSQKAAISSVVGSTRAGGNSCSKSCPNRILREPDVTMKLPCQKLYSE